MFAEGRFPARARDVHDPAPAALRASRARARASRAVRGHHVHLPRGLPVLVRHVVEVAPARGAGVVDQHVRLAQRRRAPPPSMRSPASGSVTSQASAAARPPAARQLVDRLLEALAASAPRAARTRPRRTAARAVSSPMPRLAPVTTHTLPARPRSTPRSLGSGRASRRARRARSGRKTAPARVLLIMFRRFCRQNRSGRYRPSRAAEFSPRRPGRPRRGEAGEPTSHSGRLAGVLGANRREPLRRRSAISFGASPTANPVSVGKRSMVDQQPFGPPAGASLETTEAAHADGRQPRSALSWRWSRWR